MNKKSVINNRKVEHIKIVLEKETEPNQSPFAKYSLNYKALPEISLSEVDTSTRFLGFNLAFPFLLSSMTGGPSEGETININLAKACEKAGCALALGSMRLVLKDKSAISTFDVKKYCPSIPLFANLGLVQLNYGCGADEINFLLDTINADGIFLHVNPIQEAIQPEGDTNFNGLITKLSNLLRKVNKPVLIKEVGTGIDHTTASALKEIGIKWIDVSGLGGTSWSRIEAYRRQDDLGYAFDDVGVPTDIALKQAAKIKGLNLIAGGGIRNGLDIAKSLVMGAKLSTSATPFLRPAMIDSKSCYEKLSLWKRQLQIAMFSTGSKNIKELKRTKLSITAQS